MPSEVKPAKPPRKERLKAMLSAYGSVGISVYCTIFGLVLIAFVVAITRGAQVEGVASTAGTWAAAYLATKLTQPLRILATLALTPLVARVLRRWRRGTP